MLLFLTLFFYFWWFLKIQFTQLSVSLIGWLWMEFVYYQCCFSGGHPHFQMFSMDSFPLFHPSIQPSIHLCWAERVAPWTSRRTRETNSLLNVHVLWLWEGAGVEHRWHRESNTTTQKGAGWESNPQPSCCEAAVLNTAPPRQPKQHLCFNNSCCCCI